MTSRDQLRLIMSSQQLSGVYLLPVKYSIDAQYFAVISTKQRYIYFFTVISKAVNDYIKITEANE